MRIKSRSSSVRLDVDRFGRICFTTISTGMNPNEWERRLEGRGCFISEEARKVLGVQGLVSNKGQVYRVIVCPSTEISKPDHRVGHIREYAFKMRWKIPHWEVACLIRYIFSNSLMEDIGLWSVITMHEPIKFGKDLCLFSANRFEDRCSLDIVSGELSSRFSGCNGFVFES